MESGLADSRECVKSVPDAPCEGMGGWCALIDLEVLESHARPSSSVMTTSLR